jgi:hypothetical protein
MAGKQLKVFILSELPDQISCGKNQYDRDDQSEIEFHEFSPPLFFKDTGTIIAQKNCRSKSNTAENLTKPLIINYPKNNIKEVQFMSEGKNVRIAADIAEKIQENILLEKVLKYLRKWRDWKYFDLSLPFVMAAIFALLLIFSAFLGGQQN